MVTTATEREIVVMGDGTAALNSRLPISIGTKIISRVVRKSLGFDILPVLGSIHYIQLAAHFFYTCMPLYETCDCPLRPFFVVIMITPEAARLP